MKRARLARTGLQSFDLFSDQGLDVIILILLIRVGLVSMTVTAGRLHTLEIKNKISQMEEHIIKLPDTVGFLLCAKPALHATNLRENVHYLCHTLSFLSQVARHEDSPVASLNARLIALLVFLPLATSLCRHTLDINY